MVFKENANVLVLISHFDWLQPSRKLLKGGEFRIKYRKVNIFWPLSTRDPCFQDYHPVLLIPLKALHIVFCRGRNHIVFFQQGELCIHWQYETTYASTLLLSIKQQTSCVWKSVTTTNIIQKKPNGGLVSFRLIGLFHSSVWLPEFQIGRFWQMFFSETVFSLCSLMYMLPAGSLLVFYPWDQVLVPKSKFFSLPS